MLDIIRVEQDWLMLRALHCLKVLCCLLILFPFFFPSIWQVRPYPRRAFTDRESTLSLSELGLDSKQEALFLELI